MGFPAGVNSQGLPLLIQNLFKKKTQASTIVVKPLFNFEEAEYYMELTVSQWNGPAALQMSGLTNALAFIPNVVLTAIPGGNRLTEVFSDIFKYLAKPVLQQMYAFPLCTQLVDAQAPRWEEKSLVEGTAQALSGVASNITYRLAGMLGAGVGSDMVNAAQVVTGLAPNEFLTLMFKGPSFKKYNLTWIFSPNDETAAKNLRNTIRELNSYVAPELLTSVGSLLWQYPSIFQVAFRKRSGPDLGPQFYKFKPAVCDQLTIDYAVSGIPTFLPGGYPESVAISMSFHEIEMWKSQDFDADWPAN